jgi:DNA-binding transcriptional regulator YdaS (Cro superfamily)
MAKHHPTLHPFIYRMPIPARQLFADQCGVSLGHLTNMARGTVAVSAASAMLMEHHSFGLLRCEELLPEMPWHAIRVCVRCGRSPEPGQGSYASKALRKVTSEPAAAEA